jgi:hypothetical protein
LGVARLLLKAILRRNLIAARHSPPVINDELEALGEARLVDKWAKPVGDEGAVNQQHRLTRSMNVVLERRSPYVCTFHFSPFGRFRERIAEAHL